MPAASGKRDRASIVNLSSRPDLNGKEVCADQRPNDSIAPTIAQAAAALHAHTHLHGRKKREPSPARICPHTPPLADAPQCKVVRFIESKQRYAVQVAGEKLLVKGSSLVFLETPTPPREVTTTPTETAQTGSGAVAAELSPLPALSEARTAAAAATGVDSADKPADKPQAPLPTWLQDALGCFCLPVGSRGPSMVPPAKLQLSGGPVAV